jgi:hypothetical protein
LDAWLLHGKLHVVGTEGPARVEVRKVGRRGLNVTVSDGVLSVRHDAPKSWWGWSVGWGFHLRKANYFAEVIIAVPPEVAADLTVVAGDVVASGLRTSAAVDVTSGSIALMGLGGMVRAKTVSGSIEAVGVSGDLAMHAVSGEISVAGSSADRVQVKTISGAVTCDLDNPYVRDLNVETVSGSITVRVPEDADLAVSLGAASGGVSSAFPQVPTARVMGIQSATGRLGDGTGRLRAYAVSGSVSLLASPAGGAGEEDEAGATRTVRRGPEAT